jgi:hypothetical protein
MGEAITYPIVKYDANGNCTYNEKSDGNWFRKEFNNDNKLTIYTDDLGNWWDLKYFPDTTCPYIDL